MLKAMDAGANTADALPPLPRSPELMSVGETALLVVDVQEKLIGLIGEHQRLVWNIRRLIDGARMLGVPVAATEQYPQGLGGTVAELASRLGAIASKLTFSCGGCPQVFHSFQQQGIFKVLLAGIEAHVCVQQTAFDLLAAGFRVYLAVDAVGSRSELDRQIALQRMESAGVTLTTTEAALFEWTAAAGTAAFKEIRALVKEEFGKAESGKRGAGSERSAFHVLLWRRHPFPLSAFRSPLFPHSTLDTQ